MGRVLLGLYVEPIGLLPSDAHQFQFVLGVDDVALILRFDPLGWDGRIVGGFGQMEEGGCGGVGLEGDVAIVGTLNKYTNSSKSTSAGTEENSYVIEADTATTAIVNLISKNYNSAHTLTSTEQDRYRVAADGSLTLISIDIQYANGSTTHLVMN